MSYNLKKELLKALGAVKRTLKEYKYYIKDTENEDEYSEYLVNENDISEFFNLNPKFVETFKSFIHA